MPAPRRRSSPSATLLPAALFLVALGWFTIRIGEPPAYLHDEAFYAYTAGHFVQGHIDIDTYGGPDPRGTGFAYVWNHPPWGCS